MDNRKAYAASQGIVASESLDTIPSRRIYFQVPPEMMEEIVPLDLVHRLPSSVYRDFDFEPFLKYLPEIEAEIFWLLRIKNKHQKHIAKLLHVSQPTVSYRYQRILEKLSYIVLISNLNIAKMVGEISFLKEDEKGILIDLFFYTNQEMVGKKHNRRQSSVKWILVKTIRELRKLEEEDSEKWFNYLGIMLLLFNNLRLRIFN